MAENYFELTVSKMRCLILLAVLALATATNSFSHDGFKVYRITPSNQEQIQFLDTLKENDDYDFWTKGRSINALCDVMVNPNAQAKFEDLLEQNGIQYEILIENVEKVVENERIAQLRAPKANNDQITFSKYHSYNEMLRYMRLVLERNYGKIVKLHTAGKSVLQNDLVVVQISSNHEAKKPVIFIDGGIHAREWISPATALYIIKELVQNKANQHLLERFDWHILPMLNPDGYQYTQSVNRMWRKNRGQGNSQCQGVDLNRNFGDHWGGKGTSTDPCSEIYIGKSPFSEPEAKALATYLLSISNRTKLYLTLHSYGQYILHPWGYDEVLPKDADELKRLGDLVGNSIESVYGTKYQVGSVTQLLYPGAGGSDDWAKSGANIKYSYTIELPGGGTAGFDLPPSKIIKVVTETFEGIKAFHNDLVKNN